MTNVRYFVGKNPLTASYLFTHTLGEPIIPSHKELVLYEGDEYIVHNVCHCYTEGNYGIEVYMVPYNFELEDF